MLHPQPSQIYYLNNLAKCIGSYNYLAYKECITLNRNKMAYLVDFNIDGNVNIAKFWERETAEKFAKSIADLGGKAIVYPFDPYSKDKKAFGY